MIKDHQDLQGRQGNLDLTECQDQLGQKDLPDLMERQVLMGSPADQEPQEIEELQEKEAYVQNIVLLTVAFSLRMELVVKHLSVHLLLIMNFFPFTSDFNKI